MSKPILSPETIKIYAEASNILNLKEDVANTLIPEVEYRIRELIQDAAKFMRHSKRKRLSTSDINHALRLKNTETLYGFSSPEPLKFIRPTSDQDLYIVEDSEIEVEDLLSAPLPRCPTECSFTMHWLAVNGVQPLIPQNPIPVEDQASSQNLDQEIINQKTNDANIQIRQLTRHKISQELLQYLEKIKDGILEPLVKVNVNATTGIFDTSNTLTSSLNGNAPAALLGRSSNYTTSPNPIQRKIIRSLTIDPGLQQLVPYISQFIAEQVRANLRNLAVLNSLMEATSAMLKNPHMNAEPYLHQLMPSIITCIVGGRLCRDPSEDHWGLREFAVHILSSICKRFNHTYQSLQPRLVKTLFSALMDTSKPLTTLYGAIVGLSSLGNHVVQMLILPNLKLIGDIINTSLSCREPLKRIEARKCHGVLLQTCGRYFVSQGESVRRSAILSFTQGSDTAGKSQPSAATTFKKSNITTSTSISTSISTSTGTSTNANGAILPESGHGDEMQAPIKTEPGNGPTQENGSERDSADMDEESAPGQGQPKAAQVIVQKQDLPPPPDRYSELFEVFGEGLIPYALTGAFGVFLPEADVLL